MVRKLQIKSENPKSTREAILETAAEMFSTKGFAGTSMSDLAENLGLSKAAIYHHFDSKESIFQTLLKSSTDDLEKLVAGHKKLPSSESERCQILREFVDFIYRHRKVVRLTRSEMHAEAKVHSSQAHAPMSRLMELLAGKNANHECMVRARIAIGSVFLGLFPFSYEGRVETTEQDMELLVEIAADTLGIPQEARQH